MAHTVGLTWWGLWGSWAELFHQEHWALSSIENLAWLVSYQRTVCLFHKEQLAPFPAPPFETKLVPAPDFWCTIYFLRASLALGSDDVIDALCSSVGPAFGPGR